MKKIRLKVATIVKYEDKFLLIREKYWGGSDHKWNIGTGSYEANDGNIVNSSVREVREETGLDIKVIGLHKVVLAEKEDRVKFYFVFVADSFDDKVALPPKLAQDELGESIIDYKWSSKEEILAMSDDEFVTSTIAEIIKDYLQSPEIFHTKIIEHLPVEVCY